MMLFSGYHRSRIVTFHSSVRTGKISIMGGLDYRSRLVDDLNVLWTIAQTYDCCLMVIGYVNLNLRDKA